MPNPRKPSALRLIEGNRGKREIPKTPEVDADGKLKPPNWLKGDARKEWARIVPRFALWGIGDKIDYAPLIAYCTAFADMQEATRQIAEHGRVTREPVLNTRGEVLGEKEVKSAWLSVQKDAKDQMFKALAAMGVTPSARSAMLQIPGDGKKRSATRSDPAGILG